MVRIKVRKYHKMVENSIIAESDKIITFNTPADEVNTTVRALID